MKGFVMDADFLFSEAGVELLAEHGDEGFVIFMGLCSLIWKSDDTQLSLTKFSTHARRLGRDQGKVTEVVGFLLQSGVFQKIGDCGFTHPELYRDKQKLQQKQEIYRQNAKSTSANNRLPVAEQSLSNGSAMAKQQLSNGKANHMNLNTEHEYELDLKKIDSLTRDTCEMKLEQSGLSKEDFPRALEIVTRHYHQNPAKRRPGGLVFDINASWVVQELLKEKTAKERHRAATAPPEDPEERKKREIRERIAKRKEAERGQIAN